MYDAVSLAGGIRPTKNGYLAANARVARTGIQVYRGWEIGRPDMDKVRIYRPPEEVFKRDALKSLAHIPVTYTHPPDTVDATNWDQYSVGHTGGDVVRDGDYVRVPMMLCDRGAIDAYRRDGVKELSVGYSCELDWTPGTTKDGQAYDAVQKDIRGNHLAVVPVARGGEFLRLGDAATATFRKGPKPEYSMGNDPLPDEYGKGEADDCDEDEDDQQMGPGPDRDTADAWPKRRNGDDEDDDEDDDDDGDTKDGVIYPVGDREFSEEQRKKAAASGAAMKGGGFPIKNKEDLANARQALGRAKNRSATIAHIKKRAKALGAKLPENWPNDSATTDAAAGGTIAKGIKGMRTIMLDDVPLELADKDAALVLSRFARLEKIIADQKAEMNMKKAEEEEEDEEETRAMDALRQAVEHRDGEIAALKKQLRDALDPARTEAAAKARAAVIARASSVLDKAFVFDGKSEADIRRAAVTQHLGDDAKGMSDAAIEGAFKMIKPGAVGVSITQPQYSSASPQYFSSNGAHQDSVDGNQRLRDAIQEANLRRGAPNGSMDQAVAARDAAFAELEERSRNAWRGKNGQGLKS
jgi:hypothetical protein